MWRAGACLCGETMKLSALRNIQHEKRGKSFSRLTKASKVCDQSQSTCGTCHFVCFRFQAIIACTHTSHAFITYFGCYHFVPSPIRRQWNCAQANRGSISSGSESFLMLIALRRRLLARRMAKVFHFQDKVQNSSDSKNLLAEDANSD